jgi:hypothetical protein
MVEESEEKMSIRAIGGWCKMLQKNNQLIRRTEGDCEFLLEMLDYFGITKNRHRQAAGVERGLNARLL